MSRIEAGIARGVGDARGVVMGEPDRFVAKLEAERKSLLDLSLRNPLLNYRARVRGLEFVGESPAELYRLLVSSGKGLAFLPAPDGAHVAPSGETSEPSWVPIPTDPTDLKLQTVLLQGELQSRLLAISLAARTAFEEQGVNTLFLALGMLRWFEPDSPGRPLRAPLILVPVDLERSNARERFRLWYDGGDLDLNLSLAEKLRTCFDVTLPEVPEADDLDVTSYFDAVAEAVVGRESWAVEREVAVLGFFSFGKFLMYRDLDPDAWIEAESPRAHPILGALLGEGFDESGARQTNTDDPPPAFEDGVHLVLDADGTQTAALRDAAAGAHLVIQGPPGTGKSQTITNLIADALARGRTVLFVAEKMAALDVVKRRLEAAGVGETCLELHSSKTRKKSVLEQVRRTLVAAPPRGPDPAVVPGRRAELARAIEEYRGAVNEPVGASGVTPREAIGELMRLEETSPNRVVPGLVEELLPDWGPADYARRLELMHRLQDWASDRGPVRSHPFFGCRRTAWLPGDEDGLRERLRVARHATLALREAAAALARFLRLPPAETREATARWVSVARSVAEAAGWQGVQVRGEWLSRSEDLRDVLDAGRRLQALRERWDAVVLPAAWDHDWSGVRRVLNTRGRRWWWWASPECHRAVGELAAFCRAAPPHGLEDRLALIDAIGEAGVLRGRLAKGEALASRLFSGKWRGERSDWTALERAAEGMTRIHTGVREGTFPRSLLDFLAEAPALGGLETLVRTVETALTSHHEAVLRVVDFLDLDGTRGRFGEDDLACRGFREQLSVWEDWSRGVRLVESLASWNRLADQCRDQGLGAFVALAEGESPEAVPLVSAFKHAWYRGLIRRAFLERPSLSDFDANARERAVTQFAEADRQTLLENRALLARRHWESLPHHAAGGQLGLLRRELAKKSRHLPVRQLMARAGRAVQAVKPVFLMSPLSVAAYLPPGSLRFDLVVFDEASQVKPVDALGALWRGRQAVVVGDSRQLPPSTFFDRLTSGDDEDDETSAELESVLGLFLAQGATERMLRWHYRSRHESLIAVANREFYDDRLVVFPSPDVGRSRSGLVLRHLGETVYDRGKSRTNPGEAEAVARAVLGFAREQTGVPQESRLSLGVATFSTAQRNAVIAQVERLRRDDPECEPFFDPGVTEPFFIKNLENVQGDERDVIFISVGYGRTAEGTVAHNFGPLNTEGGERRLNVLITRARIRCEVFTNLTARDLDTARTRSLGVKAFRAFLQYAESGRIEGETGEPAESYPSRFDAAVSERLRSAGHEVHPGIGSPDQQIDLAVCDPARPERYVLGLLGDGPDAGDEGTTRDRERLRPEVLRSLGWTLARVWAPEWLDRPASALNRVESALAGSPDGDRSSPEIVNEPAIPTGLAALEGPLATEGNLVPGGASSEVANSDEVIPYRTADLTPLFSDADHATLSPALLDRAVSEVVKIEGPVHRAEVMRRIAAASGVRRIMARLVEDVESALELAVERGEIRREGDFVRDAGSLTPKIRDRSAAGPHSRKWEHIADEERDGAVLKVLRDSFGAEPQEVPSAVSRLLGLSRVTDEVRDGVGAAVERLTLSGRIKTRLGQLVRAEPAPPPQGEGAGSPPSPV